MTDATLTPSPPHSPDLLGSIGPAPIARPALPGPSILRADATVRALRPDDIPAVCDLFVATFRRQGRTARATVERDLADTYLTAPGDRAEPASRVYVGPGGRVDGFMGVVTLAARFRERSLRCGILGSFMGREAERARAGVKLSRATVALGLDLLFSDTASRGSADIARSFGFDVLPAHSLGWLKVLRPFGTGAALLGRSPPWFASTLAAAARGADRFAARLPHAALSPGGASGGVARPIPVADGFARAHQLLARFALRPAWTGDEAAWLLETVGRREVDGPLAAREVLDRRGAAIGVVLFHARPGGVARVLQLLAARGREAAVVDAAIREAAALGAVAVAGRTSPTVSAGLLWQRGILYRRAPAAIGYARDPEIHAALLSDGACLGGLFGETWMLPDGLA